ncbi:MAG: neutral/alkaline non-lysosomal ceramidase N-terminal domain-containing protein, partial [Cyclobacteriaceae bacterium]|nr:neutral/alkaline non-lysosomal ceramidase N-terminal domain-containing protein [Cyclobacteriaceae bacterium]
MKKFTKLIIGTLATLVVFFNLLITWVDRTPYKEEGFYKKTIARIDSLYQSLPPLSAGDSLLIGWAVVNITPSSTYPMAGYGARDPKFSEGIHDSLYVRSLLLDNGHTSVILLSADLLIIHPEVTAALIEKLAVSPWQLGQVYLTASHSHSSLGAWAPGIVGKSFSGEFDPQIINTLADHIMEAIRIADRAKLPGSFRYGELSVPDLVKNRIVGEKGEIDPWLKTFWVQNEKGIGVHGIYSAHATCLTHRFRKFSGDYPAAFVHALLQDSSIAYGGFSAGPVASMGPADLNGREWEKAMLLGNELAEQVSILKLLGMPSYHKATLRAYRIPIDLRSPQLKISQNLRVRPWLFHAILGNYPAEMSVMQVNDVLFVGTPCDFSGELALPLYTRAREKGLN